ncbi:MULTISPECIES: hypothetical protein [unclassified Bradyrhizobium]|uniref:hypothetical protein n=1 Tax=unclassified Bradyrhizobium TaxID=2631580 RepID=UPI002915FDDD|nr:MULTISPECIES: hypothetical protein [unclassified Bradyrhizobium]
MATVNWDDPCARYAALRDAYFQIVSGGGETLIRTKGPEGEQEVRFHAADLDTLRNEMNAAQAECAASTAGVNPRRRFAIRAGSQRTCLPPGRYRY